MLRHHFPNLKWLQTQAENKFSNPLATGWPHIIMNTKATKAYRPNIRGPISLFMNVRGFSHCQVENRRVLIHPGVFYLTQQDQYYTLEIENPNTTETFNIHFKEHFQDEVYSSLFLKDETQLDDPQGTLEAPLVFNTSYSKKPLNRKFQSIYQEVISGVDSLREEEILWDLMRALLHQRAELDKTLHQLPGTKKSTQIELFQRLSFAKDYMQTCFQEPLQLEQLAQAATLSKYHFIRAFKACFGVTPHQYLIQVRINQAKILLKHSRLSATQIALDTGFETSSNFSRRFFNHVGVRPSRYRELLK